VTIARVTHCVGGVVAPLLANVALSVLDEHFAEAWQAAGTSYQRSKRRQQGFATYRLVRYADDFVVMVAGTVAHAADLREEIAAVLEKSGIAAQMKTYGLWEEWEKGKRGRSSR
jgi:RNA-directed DNA polymerase